MPYRYQIWKEPDVLNSDHDAHHTNVPLRVSHPVGPVHLQGTAAVVCGIAMKPALDRALMDLLNLPLEAVQARFAEQMTINIHSQLYKGRTLIKSVVANGFDSTKAFTSDLALSGYWHMCTVQAPFIIQVPEIEVEAYNDIWTVTNTGVAVADDPGMWEVVARYIGVVLFYFTVTVEGLERTFAVIRWFSERYNLGQPFPRKIWREFADTNYIIPASMIDTRVLAVPRLRGNYVVVVNDFV